MFGIFAPNPGNENDITIVQTVREANAEYETQIAEIKSRYDYDMCFVTGEPCEWSLAIAVYAVKTNRTEDVVTFDDEKAEVLKEIYRRLNRILLTAEQEQWLAEVTPSKVPICVTRTIFEYYLANKPADSDWCVLPITNMEAYLASSALSRMYLKELNNLFMVRKESAGVMGVYKMVVGNPSESL